MKATTNGRTNGQNVKAFPAKSTKLKTDSQASKYHSYGPHKNKHETHNEILEQSRGDRSVYEKLSSCFGVVALGHSGDS